MKLTVVLLALTLSPVAAHADSGQAPASSGVITVTRTADGKGCDVVLSLEAAKKTARDQLWLVVDGKSEGFGGGYYDAQAPKTPLRYTGSISGDLDGSIKDILKAQGFPIKENTITYHVSFGVNQPDSGSISETLHFRHGSNVLMFTQLPATATYKVGDRIPIFEAVALDSSITMRDALGPNNDISSRKFVHLPNDLLHRITIQVQFVPKTTP